MLNEMVLKAERQTAGQVDPFEEHAKRPLKEHVDAFQQHLRHKGNSAQHVYEVATKIRRIVAGCRWTYTCAQQGRSAFEFIHHSIVAYFTEQGFPSLLALPP